MKLQRIEIVGFRGALTAVEIGTPGGRSVVLFGENAQGKTTIVDGIECYFSGRVDHLARADVGRAAYRHRRLAAETSARISLEFLDATFNGSLEVDSQHHISFVPIGTNADAFRERVGQERIILRHRDLSGFVDKTKTQKLEFLAPLIGVEHLLGVRSELRTAAQQLQEELRRQDRLIEDCQRTICEQLGVKEFSQEAIWTALAAQFAVISSEQPPLTVDDLRTSLDGIQVSQDSRRDEELRHLGNARESIAHLPTAESVAVPGREFVETFNDLAHDREAFRKLALADLWRAGLQVLRSPSWEGHACPLCSAEISDPRVLENDLEVSLEALAAINSRRADVNTKRGIAQTAARSTLTGLQAAADNVGQISLSAFGETLKLAISRTGDLLDLLNTTLTEGASVDDLILRTCDEVLVALASSVPSALEEIEGRLREKDLAPEEHLRLETYGLLRSLESDMRHHAELAAERGVVQTEAEVLKLVLDRFQDFERKSINDILIKISSNVAKYYEALHGAGRFSNVRLVYLEDERGLEFYFEANGETITPPRLILSESQMNSLGLCLFLATAREFNTNCHFLILDDVINSFDSGHRSQLADLLATEFEDLQLLVMTHDRNWFDFIRRRVPAWKALRLTGWTFEGGINILDSPNEDRIRILNLLNSDGPEVAGNSARIYIESRLKYLARNLQVLVPYKEGESNERRTPGELFPHLRRHVASRRGFQLSTPDIWEQVLASLFFADDASHDPPSDTVGVTSGDVHYVIEKIDLLVEQFHCQSCNQWVWKLRQDGNKPECRCECGSLVFQ